MFIFRADGSELPNSPSLLPILETSGGIIWKDVGFSTPFYLWPNESLWANACPNASVHLVCMLAGWLLHFNFAGPPSSPVLPEISRIVYQWHEIFLYGLGQWGRDTNSVSIHLKFIGNTFKSSESTKHHHSHSISVIEKRSWVVLSKNGSNFFPRPFQRL